MIVRILSEGQFEVPDSQVDALNVLDDTVHSAINAGDEVAFTNALGALLDAVHKVGGPIDIDDVVASDAILPPADATINEARELLQEDGLIPG
ncbi:MAG: PspA-associated protein PspAA [Marmoricola sp.]